MSVIPPRTWTFRLVSSDRNGLTRLYTMGNIRGAAGINVNYTITIKHLEYSFSDPYNNS